MVDAAQIALWGFAVGNYVAAGGFKFALLVAYGEERDDCSLRNDFLQHRSLPENQRFELYLAVLLFVVGWPVIELIEAIRRHLHPDYAE